MSADIYPISLPSKQLQRSLLRLEPGPCGLKPAVTMSDQAPKLWGSRVARCNGVSVREQDLLWLRYHDKRARQIQRAIRDSWYVATYKGES